MNAFRLPPSAFRWLALAAALSCGCQHRKPLPVVGDAGPAVEVVEVDKSRPQMPKVPFVDEKEPDDELTQAQPLAPSTGIRGTMAAPHPGKKGKLQSDVDLYAWMDPAAPRDAAGFDYARVELSGVPGLDLALEVLDGDGKRLVAVNDGGPGEPEVVTNVGVDPAHTYYLRVHEAGVPHGDAAHPYELTVSSWAAAPDEEREPDDDAAHATPIRLTSGTSGQATGFFGRKHDEDWLTLSLAGVPAGPDGRALVRLELAPPEGVTAQLKVQGQKELFAEARGQKNDELRLRNVGVNVAEGTVAIALRAVDGRSTDTRWVLRVGVEPPLDGAEREPNNDVAHATPMPLTNGTAQLAGFLWPGDGDVYHVTGAPPDALVSFDVDGVDKVNLRLERLGADGRSWVRADDAREGQGETLPPARLGDGYVRVSAHGSDTAFDAPYHLTATVAQPAPDEEREPNDTAQTATPFAGTAMRGRLAPRGDEDWYAVTGSGAPLSPKVDGPVPASVRVVDESRRSVPPGTPLAAGKRYFVVVRALSERSANPRDLYTITLGP